MTFTDWHTCICGKRAYHRKSDAKKIRRHIGDNTMSVYRCQHSDGWHIGHPPPGLKEGRIGRDQIGAAAIRPSVYNRRGETA
ncbi:hypothetical protein [Gordonia insulae]|uniref:Uncharacterized protein n=1 Tax=Gordonia insulae TaxID=2420509 RepID=A0A3G8JG25_9ACTN|nr:hypothetical protein [Gordonia insulae]AZG43462.1 hypothetical protein D7316_00026 [Gordonia insulae]